MVTSVSNKSRGPVCIRSAYDSHARRRARVESSLLPLTRQQHLDLLCTTPCGRRDGVGDVCGGALPVVATPARPPLAALDSTKSAGAARVLRTIPFVGGVQDNHTIASATLRTPDGRQSRRASFGTWAWKHSSPAQACYARSKTVRTRPRRRQRRDRRAIGVPAGCRVGSIAETSGSRSGRGEQGSDRWGTRIRRPELNRFGTSTRPLASARGWRPHQTDQEGAQSFYVLHPDRHAVCPLRLCLVLVGGQRFSQKHDVMRAAGSRPN
jgi:hypothetical protein